MVAIRQEVKDALAFIWAKVRKALRAKGRKPSRKLKAAFATLKNALEAVENLLLIKREERLCLERAEKDKRARLKNDPKRLRQREKERRRTLRMKGVLAPLRHERPDDTERRTLLTIRPNTDVRHARGTR